MSSCLSPTKTSDPTQETSETELKSEQKTNEVTAQALTSQDVSPPSLTAYEGVTEDAIDNERLGSWIEDVEMEEEQRTSCIHAQQRRESEGAGSCKRRSSVISVSTTDDAVTASTNDATTVWSRGLSPAEIADTQERMQRNNNCTLYMSQIGKSVTFTLPSEAKAAERFKKYAICYLRNSLLIKQMFTLWGITSKVKQREYIRAHAIEFDQRSKGLHKKLFKQQNVQVDGELRRAEFLNHKT
jgi:hypothetical protein